jgi:photosystem II stability/assembly factor-like uncharacterized protein
MSSRTAAEKSVQTVDQIRGRRTFASFFIVLAVVLVPTVLGGPASRAFASTPTFFSTGDGGWVWQNPLPQGNTLNSVSCGSASFCIAVGDHSTILTSSDGGLTWIVQKLLGTADRFVSVSCPSPTTCFVADQSNDQIFATRDSGQAQRRMSKGSQALRVGRRWRV